MYSTQYFLLNEEEKVSDYQVGNLVTLNNKGKITKHKDENIVQNLGAIIGVFADHICFEMGEYRMGRAYKDEGRFYADLNLGGRDTK